MLWCQGGEGCTVPGVNAPLLDAMPALPLVGLEVAMPYDLSVRLPEIMAPELDDWKTVEKVQLLPNSGLAAETSDGIRLEVKHDNLVVASHLRVSGQEEAGAFYPVFSYPDLELYSALLDRVQRYTTRCVTRLAEAGEFQVRRIGVLVNLRPRDETMPPGLRWLVSHLEGPWEDGLTRVDVKLLAELESCEHGTSRCHHNIAFDRGAPGPLGYTVSLDWQYVYSSPLRVSQKVSTLTGEIRRCAVSATEYFEEASFHARSG